MKTMGKHGEGVEFASTENLKREQIRNQGGFLLKYDMKYTYKTSQIKNKVSNVTLFYIKVWPYQVQDHYYVISWSYCLEEKAAF